MSRARNIKPGFFRNADLVELPFEARLLFIGLWTMADRDGRMEDRPKQIKMELFPADNVDCDALLSQLAAINMVVRYEHGGKRYLQVVNFVKHQNPHRDEKPSTMPDQYGDVVDTKSAPVKHRASKVVKQADHIDTDMRAPVEHGASTVQAPCKDGAGTVSLGLNPDPRSLIADPRYLIPESKGGETVVFEQRERIEDPPLPSKSAAICMVLKSKGIGFVNPSHPELVALLEAGAEVGHFADVATACIAKGKPDFAYVLGVVRGQMRDAASLSATQLQRPQVAAQPETFAERDARQGRKRWEEISGRSHPDNMKNQAGDVIDAGKPLELSHDRML